MSIKVKCKSFILVFFLTGTLFLSGCFPEGIKGCPEEMLVSFSLDDPYDEGDFDSRIANNVHLCIFKDRQLFKIYDIPYEEIKAGKQIAIDKASGIEGELDLIAWSISRDINENEYAPQWIGENSPEQITLDLRPATKSGTRYNPVTTNHFIGSISTREYIDQETIHEINMNVTTCRIEVNIHDPGQTFTAAQNAHIEVNGTLDHITMGRTGTGSPATIVTGLTPNENDTWSTGRFGVYPSGEGQTVSVEIFSNGTLIETLTVPQENLPRGAESGALLIFEYTLYQAYYFLTIDGFTVKVVNVDDM